MIVTPISPTPHGIPQTAKGISDGLEKAFLSEMFKYAGPKPLDGQFGGGIGEEQMSSMLTEIYAESLAARLDLGIAPKAGGAA